MIARLHRRLAVASVLVLGALAVSGCGTGFDATSTRPYAPSDGVRVDSGHLRVINALVVAGDSMTSGVVSLTISNRGSGADRLTDLTSPAGTVELTGDAKLAPGSAVRLGANGDVAATIGGLTRLPGETITLELRFARAEPVRLHTLVVPATGPYESETAPAPTPSS